MSEGGHRANNAQAFRPGSRDVEESTAMCRARGTDYSKPAGEGMGDCMAVSQAGGKPGVWFVFGHLSNSGQLWTTALYSRRSSKSRSRSSGCSMRGPMPMLRPVIRGLWHYRLVPRTAKKEGFHPAKERACVSWTSPGTRADFRARARQKKKCESQKCNMPMPMPMAGLCCACEL